ncbi:hypothetical protein IFR05_007717 [Cadophora sp. M221]|nr:hypothetical protein IFR05_007717 [Cadophora sp. M221]
MPLDSRCWTYQEILLSRRILSFYADGLEWQCPSQIESDDMLQAEEASIAKASSSSSRTTEALRQLALAPQTQSLSRLWWTLVADYSMGDLTVLDDKLLALSAIASEFHHLRPDQYLAGLWRSTIVMDLLWSTRHKDVSDGHRSVIKSRERETKYPIPTWSWSSLNRATISNYPGSFDTPSPRVDIRTCETFPVSEGAPFGLINGGTLILSAPVKKLGIRDVWKHFCADAFGNFGPLHKREMPERLGSLVLDDAPHFGHLVGDTTDEENEDLLACRLGLPCGENMVCFLGLARKDESGVETSGLALVRRGDGKFERVGIFYAGATFMNREPDREPDTVQQGLMDRWGDDYVINTMSIV